jgi:hypothetical protein
MASHGSPFWQASLFFLAVLFIIWELWAGWRRGVVRGGIHFFAFVLSGVVGFLAGQVAAAVVERLVPGFGLMAGLLLGSFLTLALLALTLILGAILFKRTGQQPSAMLRFVFGLGGSFFGLLTAMFILWGGISIIRSFGAIAESSVSGPAEVPAIAKGLVTLKESLELGAPGEVVKTVDAVPPQTYELIVRVGRLIHDQDAMTRLLDFPGVQEIMANPRMAALVNDPEVATAAERRDLFTLIRNPKMIAAATDPELSKLLMNLDLQKALDYALPPAQTSPTPESRQ